MVDLYDLVDGKRPGDDGDPDVMAVLDLGRDHMIVRVVDHKNRDAFLSFCDLIRAQYPKQFRIAVVLDNFSPHLSTRVDDRVGRWAEANNVEFVYVPTNASWLNRIEGHFQALRYFALDGTDHHSHQEQNRMIRRYIAWRNRHAKDEALRAISKLANVA